MFFVINALNYINYGITKMFVLAARSDNAMSTEPPSESTWVAEFPNLAHRFLTAGLCSEDAGVMVLRSTDRFNADNQFRKPVEIQALIILPLDIGASAPV